MTEDAVPLLEHRAIFDSAAVGETGGALDAQAVVT